MDSYPKMDKECGKLEQIVSQFLLKILHVVLGSRMPSFRLQDRSGELLSGSRVRKSDRWFNLVLGDRPAALENLNFWHKNILDPMIINIILVQQGSSSEPVDNLYSAAPATPAKETVIERWVVQYESPRVIGTQSNESSSNYTKTYKKSIILLRSLYSHMRLLPANRIFRQLSSSSQTYNFNLIYKVSSFSNPFSMEEEAKMGEYNFAPVEAYPGRLSVSVTYHPTFSDFNIEPSVSLPTKIITDYVGSPTTDPMRYFRAIEKGHHATSFSLRGAHSPLSGPQQRPHSWTSGFHQASPFLQNQNLAGSPLAYGDSPIPYDVSSPPTEMLGNKFQNNRQPTQHLATGFDDYQLSPPFSPTASPSAPTYLCRNNSLQNRIRSGTAPVTIPHPLTSKSIRYLTPNSSEPSRLSLPPLSPRRIKHDPSSQESPGIRSYRRLEASTTQESPSSSMNHYGQKPVRDGKEDSGRFSGLHSSGSSPRIGNSRSSSRLSLQDDLDDCDFSCPFDVDDVDTSDFLASLNFDGKKGPESSSHSVSRVGKSQDASVGLLVHMLRTAPPLRQDSTSYSSRSVRTEFEGGIGTASGFYMPRRKTDALEELKSYRDMKDLLLSKSGTQVIRKDA